MIDWIWSGEAGGGMCGLATTSSRQLARRSRLSCPPPVLRVSPRRPQAIPRPPISRTPCNGSLTLRASLVSLSPLLSCACGLAARSRTRPPTPTSLSTRPSPAHLAGNHTEMLAPPASASVSAVAYPPPARDLERWSPRLEPPRTSVSPSLDRHPFFAQGCQEQYNAFLPLRVQYL